MYVYVYRLISKIICIYSKHKDLNVYFSLKIMHGFNDIILNILYKISRQLQSMCL